MQIDISEQEFKDIFLLVSIGEFIMGGVSDERGEDWQKWEKIKNKFVALAQIHGFYDLVEKFKGECIMSDDFGRVVDEIIDEHNESEFWHILEVRLGQRDFFNSISEQEKENIENNHGILPFEEIDKYYDKYRKEFEDHELDRLEISGQYEK